MSSPGVIVTGLFSLPKSAKFQQYVSYMDRESAKKSKIENDFSVYQEYMGNDKKSTGLFTNELDQLTEEQKTELKNIYKKSYENGSIMWEDVISFDNEFLEKYGIYNTKTGSINEQKLRDITRDAMNTMLQKEGLGDSAIWSAAIHYNTDNIHIHAATVEPIPTRTRGMRKQKSMEAMKSKVANRIIDRGLEREQNNKIVREKIVGSKKEFSLSKDKNTRNLFHEIMQELPANKQYWQYNYEKIRHVRPKIDQLSKRYIELYHKEDFNRLSKNLDKEVEIMKDIYGVKEKARYEKYKDNKIRDLYTRLGNAVLKEMKSVSRNNIHHTYAHARTLNIKRDNNTKRVRRNLDDVFALKRMNKYLDKSYESWKNQLDYERLHNLNREHDEYERE